MIHPTIHLNGTSRAELERLYHEAVKAVDVALEALALAAPNWRDYYPQGALAQDAALIEHRLRRDVMTRVRDELIELRDGVAE